MHTGIIVTENWQDGKQTVVGFLVDSVREVVELPPDTIEPAPQMGASIDPEHIKGMGRLEDNFIIILDVNRLFSEEELETTRQVSDKEMEKQASKAA